MNWLAEIGLTVILLLLLAAVYARTSLIMNRVVLSADLDIEDFISRYNLLRARLTVPELLQLESAYLAGDRKLAFEVLPALNITLRDADGSIEVRACSWHGCPLPLANYTLIKIVLGDSGIASVEVARGTIQLGSATTSLAYDPDAAYAVLVSWYGMRTLELRIPEPMLRDNYNVSADVLYNTTDVKAVYAVHPLCGSVYPLDFYKLPDGSVKVKVEPGTAALIVVEDAGTYIVRRYKFLHAERHYNLAFFEYVMVEYYALYLAVGRWS